MTPYYQVDAVTLYLGDCREVLPGLDPVSAGSGSTGVAAKLEGHRCVLIEREERYAEIAAGRLERWRDERDWGVEPEPEDPRQMSLL